MPRKHKSHEEVTEEVSWTIEATIIGTSDQEVEKAIEDIEANLENGADVLTENVSIQEFKVTLN